MSRHERPPALDAGVVAGAVEAAEGGNCGLDRARHVGGARHVADGHQAVTTRLPHQRQRLLEVDELVRSRVGVGGTEVDGIADVAQAFEADSFHDPPVGDVETGDQTRERHRSRKRRPAAPLFSGWNWTPTKLPDSAIATMPSERAVAVGVSAAYE